LIKLTPSALSACHAFVREHGGSALNTEQLEAFVEDSLESLLVLIDDQPWLTCCDTHQFNALEAQVAGTPHTLSLNARRQAGESWMVGTPEEYPVTEEYLKRRIHSEAEILRQLQR
jgi:hypothetical protein